ncbi:hypothetical protein [Brachyspira alvinipulli]|uniref:hypothetical protein n=1 Tax=Brachyspira alvinipulli TaxID=84379 RepID=UPI000486664A|nr:hypothetical protein [Brachyspira alvinipulli]
MITYETLNLNTKKILKKEINKILKKDNVLLSNNEYTYSAYYYIRERSNIIKELSFKISNIDEIIINILENEYKNISTIRQTIFYRNKQKLYNFLKNDYKDFDSEEEKREILKQLRY